MVRNPSRLIALSLTLLLACQATTAAAHCCHDERTLGVAEQSEFRRGIHGMDEGLSDDEELEQQPPSIGGSLNGGNGSMNNGGLGQMQGNGLGNYGAGSLGERGPGGLGALHGNSIHTSPPRTR